MDAPIADEPLRAELARYEPRRQAVVAAPVLNSSEIDSLVRMGGILSRALAKPGDDGLSVDVAVTKILFGRTLGLNEAQSMSGIHVFNGQIQVSYTALLGFIRARDGYDYRIIESTDTRCTIAATDSNWMGKGRCGPAATIDDAMVIENADYAVTVTREMADREGWSKKPGGGTKHMWTQMPRIMLRARAASEIVRSHMPEVTKGMPIYVEDEVHLNESRLDAGTATGESDHVELPQAVERILTRARLLGYRALSDRSVLEVVVAGRSPEAISEWVEQARLELDACEEEHAAAAAKAKAAVDAAKAQAAQAAEEVVDAEVVPEDGDCEEHEWTEWATTVGGEMGPVTERSCVKCNLREERSNA